MIVIEHSDYNHTYIHSRIDHWLPWFHVLQEEHFSNELYILLELTVHDNEYVELHFYFKLARDVEHFI